MSDPLSTYLHDHLAGAAYAIDLVEFMRDQHKGDGLGHFAADLLVDIQADREVLRDLAERAGSGSSKLKELTAWLGEKVGRLKLRHDANDGLGIFEALEFLELGIHGKLALWRALGAVANNEPRLQGADFGQLAARAENQRERVESWRLGAAQRVFGSHVKEKDRRERHLGSREKFRQAKSHKTMVTATTGGVLLAAAALIAIEMAPDVMRYMKIRAM